MGEDTPMGPWVNELQLLKMYRYFDAQHCNPGEWEARARSRQPAYDKGG